MSVHGLDKDFWSGKRVLLTGHTGFKGSWAALWLSEMGADVTGFALEPDVAPNLFSLAAVGRDVKSRIGDLRDHALVREVVREADPHLVLHMAAQPLVRRSYREPVETFATNIMGTVHLLEALRDATALRAVLVVTTDKVYENTEQGVSFVEEDPLGGHDPYAASKAATEIVVSSYARSYFDAMGIRAATARGGNVIGGGDFSEDRLVPDIWRALSAGAPLVLRNPDAARPWQHVLDCLCGYFTFLRALADGMDVPSALNFGPPADAPAVKVSDLAAAVQSTLGADMSWKLAESAGPHEMMTLGINSTRARSALGWRDQLTGSAGIEWLADWYRAMNNGTDMRSVTLAQIAAFETRLRKESEI